MSSAVTRMRRATISARTGAGIDAQIASGSAIGDCRKIVAAVDEPGERVAEAEGGDVVERHELDLSRARRGGGSARRRWSGSRSSAGPSSRSRSADRPGRSLSNSSPTSVATSLLVVTDPKPPIEWPRSDCTRRRGRRSIGTRSSASGWRMPEDGVPRWTARRGRPGDRRPRRGRRRRRRASRARPRTTGRAGPARPRPPRRRAPTGSRGSAGWPRRAARRSARRRRPPGRAGGPRASSSAGNGRKLVTATQPTGRPWLAEVVDDGDRGVGDRAHRDEDLGRVVAAVGVDQAVACGRSGRSIRPSRSASSPGIAVGVGALADAALHVAVLVLDDAGHQRLGRIEQVADPLGADRRRTRAAARPRAAARSRACGSSGSRPGRPGTASRSPRRRGGRWRSGRPPPGRCGRTGSPSRVSATAITSSWPAWMLSAWLVSARAPTWKTTGRRLPLMTYRTSFIRTRPWPAVKFVTRPPASATPFGGGRRRVLGLGLDEAQGRAPQVRSARRRRRPGRAPPSWSTA